MKPAAEDELLAAEGDQGIDAGGAASGDVAGQERGGDEEEGDADQGADVNGADVVQDAFEDAADKINARKADGHAE
jgi:hypothetical protein